MDAQRFDSLARAFATPLDRRTALRGLLAAAGGAVAGLGRGGRAVAAEAKPCVGDADCPGKQVCLGGACHKTSGCPAGQVRCDGACVDPLSDDQHCGACGVACGAGHTCQGGGCVNPHGLASCAAQGIARPSGCDEPVSCPSVPSGGGGFIGCGAYPTVDGLCVCSSGSGFTTNWPCEWGCPDHPYCVQTGREFGFCEDSPSDFPSSGLPCQTDGDCARYRTCHADGYCGGEACQADGDCNARLGGGYGLGWACVRDDAGCLSGFSGNFCSPLCPYAA